MTEIERLEKEVELATVRLSAEQVAYRTAKLRLKEAKIAAGVIRVDDATARVAADIRDKADVFKSVICKHFLRGIADALEGRGSTDLIDLDDELFRQQTGTLRVGVWFKVDNCVWHYTGDSNSKANLVYLECVEKAKANERITRVELLRAERKWER